MQFRLRLGHDVAGAQFPEQDRGHDAVLHLVTDSHHYHVKFFDPQGLQGLFTGGVGHHCMGNLIAYLLDNSFIVIYHQDVMPLFIQGLSYAGTETAGTDHQKLFHFLLYTPYGTACLLIYGRQPLKSTDKQLLLGILEAIFPARPGQGNKEG